MKGALRVFILTGLFLLGLLGALPSKVLIYHFPVLYVSNTTRSRSLL